MVGWAVSGIGAAQGVTRLPVPTASQSTVSNHEDDVDDYVDDDYGDVDDDCDFSADNIDNDDFDDEGEFDNYVKGHNHNH